MKIISIIKVAFKNILNNKLRSIFTMLGIIIGISSVILLVGIGNGSTADISSKVKSLGTDILTVKISSEDASFKYEDMDNILKLYNIKSVAPYKTVSGTVSRETIISNKSQIIATNDNYLDVTNIEIQKGRTISIIDIENKTKVCILGYDIATTLFNLANPIGEAIKIDGDNYIVIGVLEEQGTTMGQDSDSNILIPITTAKYLGEDTNITSFYTKVENEEYIDQNIIIIENYIRSELQISSEYYTVSSQTSVLEAMEDIRKYINITSCRYC